MNPKDNKRKEEVFEENEISINELLQVNGGTDQKTDTNTDVDQTLDPIIGGELR